MPQSIFYQKKKDISDDFLRPLYQSVGWISYTDSLNDLNQLLQGSRLVISAWRDNQLIGLIRTVGDGMSIEYVQDLLVLPEFQQQGVGSQLLSMLFEETRHIRQFVLITDNGPDNQEIINWYKKQGLIPVSDANIIALWRKQEGVTNQ